MTYRIVITPEAETDLANAYSWYEEKKPGLGHNFIQQVGAAMEFIKKHPGACPVEYKCTRKFLIKKFPYKIVYLEEKDQIVILAVLHGMRNPAHMKCRIDNPR